MMMVRQLVVGDAVGFVKELLGNQFVQSLLIVRFEILVDARKVDH